MTLRNSVNHQSVDMPAFFLSHTVIERLRNRHMAQSDNHLVIFAMLKVLSDGEHAKCFHPMP